MSVFMHYTKQWAQTEDNLTGEIEDNNQPLAKHLVTSITFFPATSCL